MRNTLLLPLLFVCSLASAGKVDSLRAVYMDTHRTDSIRFDAFRNLIWKGYLFSDPDSARLLADSLYRTAGRAGANASVAQRLSRCGGHECCCDGLRGEWPWRIQTR